MKLLLTCEHASAEIPRGYQYLFKEEPSVLKTHEAYDPGAFDLFKDLEELADFSFYHSTGRLLIEVNRSEHHPKLFSRFSRKLDKAARKQVTNNFYFPYRNRVEEQIKILIQNGEKVLHLSIHSFTPVLNGEERNCDIGLLYDPSRNSEKQFCKDWKKYLQENSDYKVRMNYPYLGKADGFTTHLRKKFEKSFSGIELEVNQKFAREDKMDAVLKTIIKKSLQKLL